MSARDSIYADLAQYLAARNGAYGGRAVRAYWHGAIASSIGAWYRTAARVRELLSASQLAWLRARGLVAALEYSPAWLARLLRRPLLPQ